MKRLSATASYVPLAAIRRADVVLIVIDAAEGLSEQDVRIAGYVHEEGKPAVCYSQQVGRHREGSPTP